MSDVVPIDVLVVDVGYVGLRARRYRPEDTLRVDVPTLPPRHDAADLVSAVTALLPEGSPRPPRLCGRFETATT